MPQLTVYITKELEQLLKQYPKLNRSKIVQQALKRAISKEGGKE